MRLKPINQQVVVLMGASSGIGRAAALRFAARGAMVVCSARNEHGLASLTDEIRRKGGFALAVPADTADPEQVKHVADRAARDLGRIDTWVHLSAVSVYARFEDTHPSEFKRVMDVNLLGQIYGALAALPHLRRSGRGALIHITSVEGRVSLPFQSAYAASKHGVIGFLDSLRLELAREGVPISVTNVMPSAINTPIFEKALTRLGVAPRPTPPVYDPELVARAIVHAAKYPVRDVVVGGLGMALLAAGRVSPHLADAILLGRIGFEAQMTNRPKSPDAPNDLFEPTPDRDARIEGELGAEALRRSLPTRIAAGRVARGARRVVDALYRIAARGLEAGWYVTLPRASKRALVRRPAKARRRRRARPVESA